MVGTVLLLVALLMGAIYAFYAFAGTPPGPWFLAIALIFLIRGGWLLIRVGRRLS
jgi:hypothetical protein